MGQHFTKKLRKIQKEIEGDGWLLFDFQGRNDLACKALELKPNAHLTRRFFYWIPKEGVPIKIAHAIETLSLNHLPGTLCTYRSQQELYDHLKNTLHHKTSILMEVSTIPYLSKVDGGTLDLVRSFGVEVKTSAKVLQALTSVLSDEELDSQRRAATFVAQAIERGFQKALLGGQTEKSLQQFLLSQLEEVGMVSEWEPIVAVNANSSYPHHTPGSTPIEAGDLLLIDMGGKEPEGIYADLTRVQSLGRELHAKEKELFSALYHTLQIVLHHVRTHDAVTGATLDALARDYLTEQGYGEHFSHRLGHSITWQPHGLGAHLDSFETYDERPLLPHTCFSVEPGVYLEGILGIRLEINVLLLSPKEIEVTGGMPTA